MSITDLIPWKRSQVSVRRQNEPEPPRALDLWQRDVNRLFDEFFDLAPFRYFDQTWSTFLPRLDVVEDDKQFRISAELPGMDENDFEVSLSHNVLTIRGEKQAEKEQRGDRYYRVERAFGSFERAIPLPDGVDQDKIDATFKRGVLTVTLPKTKRFQYRTKIAVKAK